MATTHKIEAVKGHYEVYDQYDNFMFSGDTYEECYQDLIDMLVAEERDNVRMENIRRAVVA